MDSSVSGRVSSSKAWFAVLAALSACGAAPRDATDAPREDERDRQEVIALLTAFAEAARFVPAGMQSTRFAFGDPMHADPSFGDRLIVIQAGSSFRGPPAGWGRGPCDLVTVMDTRDVDAESREYVLTSPEHAEQVSIGGQQGWHLPASHETQFHAEQWGAMVDGRFAVVASSRALLEQALSRGSSLAGLVASHGSLPAIPRRFQEVLLCHSRSGEQRPFGGPVPEGDMVFVTTPDHLGLHMFATDAPLQGHWQFFDEFGLAGMRPVVATHGRWSEHVGRLPPETPPNLIQLVQWTLFGFVFWF